jgi:hypothetical protein
MATSNLMLLNGSEYRLRKHQYYQIINLRLNNSELNLKTLRLYQ